MSADVIDLSAVHRARDLAAEREGRSAHTRWPLPPRCSCGALPGHEWPMCQLAAGQGRIAADVDAEDCERWQAEAVTCGHHAEGAPE